MPKLPGQPAFTWISPPQPGALKYTEISSESDPIGEYVIRFMVGDRSYLSSVLAEDLDLERKLLRVSLIAHVEDGSYLVSLPRETLTSGTTVKVWEDAPELVYDPQ